MYSQEALFHDIHVVEGRTRLSHVKSLQLIVDKCDQTSLLLKNHSLTLMSAATY